MPCEVDAILTSPVRTPRLREVKCPESLRHTVAEPGLEYRSMGFHHATVAQGHTAGTLPMSCSWPQMSLERTSLVLSLILNPWGGGGTCSRSPELRGYPDWKLLLQSLLLLSTPSDRGQWPPKSISHGREPGLLGETADSRTWKGKVQDEPGTSCSSRKPASYQRL